MEPHIKGNLAEPVAKHVVISAKPHEHANTTQSDETRGVIELALNFNQGLVMAKPEPDDFCKELQHTTVMASNQRVANQTESDVIVLNVGGTLFETTLSTLTSVKGTFFDSMFGGRWPLTPAADGSHFIGRDPTGFSLILSCLSGETIMDDNSNNSENNDINGNINNNSNTNVVSDSELAAFIEHADYFGIPAGMVERFLNRKLPGPAFEQFACDNLSGMTLSDNNLSASFNRCQYGNYWVLGTNTYDGNDHVIIKLRVEHSARWAFFGATHDVQTITEEDSFPSFCFGGEKRREYRWPMSDTKLRYGSGDIIEVEIDCRQNKLTVRNTTRNQEDSLTLPSNKQWRLHVLFYHNKNSVTILDSKYVL